MLYVQITQTGFEIKQGGDPVFPFIVIDESQHEQLMNGTYIVSNGQIILATPVQKTSAQIANELEQAVDQHIESVAHADRWDSRITCAMRAGYPNPWQNKAIAFGQWMDTCYAHCIQVHSDVVAGLRSAPTDAELIAELPVMVWPA
jgi:hypothetical protein